MKWSGKSDSDVAARLHPLLVGGERAKLYVGSEVLTAVFMEGSLFWDITPCSPLSINQHFGGTSLPASG
jgi:hypothetical protein